MDLGAGAFFELGIVGAFVIGWIILERYAKYLDAKFKAEKKALEEKTARESAGDAP